MRKPGGRAEMVARFTGDLWVDKNDNDVVNTRRNNPILDGIWAFHLNTDMSVKMIEQGTGSTTSPYAMYRYPANIDANGIPQYSVATRMRVTKMMERQDADPLQTGSGITLTIADVNWSFNHSNVKGLRNDSLYGIIRAIFRAFRIRSMPALP